MTDDDGHAISYKVLPRGTPVRSADYIKLGTVRRVQDNVRENIFDGIVIDTPKGQRFVDAPEVARITGSRVTLTIDAAEAAQLPAHSGTMGSVHTRATRTGHRWRRWFGR